MTILETEVSNGTKTTSAVVKLTIENKDYELLSCGTTVNIRAGHALTYFRKRSLGKCFWEVSDIGKHYKKHGSILMEYAEKIKGMAYKN